MSASTTVATSSTSGYRTPVFWERLWRQSGINFVVFFIIAYVIYGYQPQVGASADALVAFYDGHRTRILIAAVVSGMAVLNLLWMSDGFWAPDGAYSRFVSPIIGLVWVVVVSRILLTRNPATHAAW